MPKNIYLHQETMYGATLVGARGQVVIPAQARKDLNIKPGDRLLVLGKLNKALGLVKAEDMAGLLDKFLVDIDKVDFEKLKKHAKQSVAKLMKKTEGSK